MPVVHVRSILPPGEEDRVDGALTEIAQAVARASGGEPSDTWCTFTRVDRMSLGERIVTGAGRIVYLDVWLRPRGAGIERAVLTEAAAAAARGFGVPLVDVWATLRPVEDGRTFAGGEVIAP
jgi:hypothetical protein